MTSTTPSSTMDTVVDPGVHLAAADDVWPTLVALKDCLCQTLAALPAPSGTECVCLIVSGAATAADYCDPGMAWVRLVSLVPNTPGTNYRGQRRITPPAACRVDERTLTVEVGVFRCAPMPDTTARPPTPPDPADIEASAKQQMADARAMRHALECCWGAGRSTFTLGPYLPLGPGGGCVGGAWTASILLPDPDELWR